MCRHYLTDAIGSLYNSKKRELLGRDGAGWAKLGIFYFLFYLGLGLFFCAMVGIFMAVTPRDRPRYYGPSSSMSSRSTTFSPGLGFRPHADTEGTLIFVNKNNNPQQPDRDVDSLQNYLDIHKATESKDNNSDSSFVISNPGDCIRENKYGFPFGKPCVLVKMNKIVDFIPIPGYRLEDEADFRSAGCEEHTDAVAIHCYGEHPVDVDHIGNISYISENGRSDRCGSLQTNWFPYKGRSQNKHSSQAPYIWVQFLNPKPNVLIDVVCRLFAENVHFNKIRGESSVRFKIYINDRSVRPSSIVEAES